MVDLPAAVSSAAVSSLKTSEFNDAEFDDVAVRGLSSRRLSRGADDAEVAENRELCNEPLAGVMLAADATAATGVESGLRFTRVPHSMHLSMAGFMEAPHFWQLRSVDMSTNLLDQSSLERVT